MGQMTFPHRFMPLLLLEQLYRARDLSLDEGTDLTRALVDNRLKYRVYDFSTENYELMQRKRRAAIQLREEYMQEGNECLYRSVYTQSVWDARHTEIAVPPLLPTIPMPHPTRPARLWRGSGLRMCVRARR